MSTPHIAFTDEDLLILYISTLSCTVTVTVTVTGISDPSF